jgi:hypothetical protein
MVMRLMIMLWLAVFAATPVWAQPPFSATADKHDIALGEPISVTLVAQDITATLDTLDLDALKTDFDIYTRSNSKQTELIKGKLRTTETTNLILYPLHTGHLQLPAFKLAGNSSRAVSINVHASGPDIPQVIFRPTLTPTHPLVRQEAILNLDIYDDGSLQWTPPKLVAPLGTYLRELAASQWDTTLAGTAFTVHRMAWAVMPLNAGNITLNFPILNAIKFGNRLRYTVPTLQFNARPAPRYLPVYVPVGKLTVASQTPSGKLSLNRPANWNLTVRGTGISVEGLTKLLPELADSETLHYYPPQIRLIETGGNTPEQTILITLPFQPLQAGTFTLPHIQLPYYDPATGRLESASTASPPITVVNPLWRTATQLAAIVSVSGLLIWLSRIGLRLYRYRRARLASLQRIATAADPHQLSRALLAFDWGTGALQAKTLRLWLVETQRRCGNNAQLTQLVHQLEADCYKRLDNKDNFAKLLQEVLLIMQNIAL